MIFFLSILLLNANDFMEKRFSISNTTQNTAIINAKNLILGQTGIVIHKFSNNASIILSKAKVISTNENNSTIEFLKEKILEQDSLSNTNLKADNNDTFILNHMYSVSLLIVPNYEASIAVKTRYLNNFIDSDLFASYLKIEDTPVPKKEDFIKFTKKNDIATLYIVIKSKLYILDTTTFALLKIVDLDIKNEKFQVPFYTNISDIKTSVFDFISEKKIANYNGYYLNLLGIK